MGVSPAWRMFRRMQYSEFVIGALFYAAAAVHAWRVLPGDARSKTLWMVLYPGVYFVATLVTPLAAPPLRRLLKTHIWISFRTGFGQSVISVLGVVLVLVTAAAFMYFDTAGALHANNVAGGGRFPVGALSAYAAGVGVLLAQALLVRRIERDPNLQAQIQVPARRPNLGGPWPG
jgi:hypothetical protein